MNRRAVIALTFSVCPLLARRLFVYRRSPVRNQLDFGRVAQLASAVAITVSTIAVSRPLGGFGQHCPDNKGSSRLQPIDCFDRQSSTGLAAFNNEQDIAARGCKERRVGESDRWGAIDYHEVELLARLRDDPADPPCRQQVRGVRR